VTGILNWLTVLAFAASLLLRNPVLFLLSVLLALVAGVTALWDRYALASVTYMRELGATRLFVGEETDISIEIVNAKPLPLAWINIEDEWPAEVMLLRGRLHYSHKPESRILLNLLSMRFYERVRKQYRVRALHRGVQQFGPVDLRSGDMFGFRWQRKKLEQFDRLIVYPQVVPVTAFGIYSAQPFGDARMRRKIAEDPLRIMGVRPYAAGDSPRFLHWKATARRGELQTKVFEPGAAQAAALFLNLDTVAGRPGVITDYLEYAICAAASLARFILDRREAVGLYVNGSRRNERGLVRLPPSRRSDRWEEILEGLARLIGLPSADFARLLGAEMALLPYGATVVAITAIVNDGILAALLDLRAAGHPVTLVAIGEEAPVVVPDGLNVYWIGGHEAYKKLVELDFHATATARP
jgi:uncharacterized protein (DUF58 family)